MKSPKAKIVTPDEATKRLEALCVKSEHCTYELRQKLWKWNISPPDADRIMKHLTSKRFVDDMRFAKSYIHDKVSFDRWGPKKIKVGLMSKRIDRDVINECLRDLDPDVLEKNLYSLLLSKASKMTDAKTYEGRTKLFRYGVSRGYDSEMISRILRTSFV